MWGLGTFSLRPHYSGAPATAGENSLDPKFGVCRGPRAGKPGLRLPAVPLSLESAAQTCSVRWGRGSLSRSVTPRLGTRWGGSHLLATGLAAAQASDQHLPGHLFPQGQHVTWGPKAQLRRAQAAAKGL